MTNNAYEHHGGQIRSRVLDYELYIRHGITKGPPLTDDRVR